MKSYEGIFVNNEFIKTAQYKNIVQPNTGREWASIPDASEEETVFAIKAARQAFKTWRKTELSQVSAYLRNLADLVMENKEELATIECHGNGKLYKELLENEIPSVAQWFYYYSGIAGQLRGEYVEINENLHSYVKKEPIGVVGAIVPWNSPLLMLAWKLGPALATRNTIVIKPSFETSASALEFAKLIVKAGFPAGVVNIVTGDLPVAKTLSTHEEIDKVAFTGSTGTAVQISKQASETLKKITFELGGKAPHIIFEDADIEKATSAAVKGIFINAGQTCAAGSRVFIHSSIYEETVEKILAKTKLLKVGEPFSPESEMGPISNEMQYNRLFDFVSRTKDEGGTLLYGGHALKIEGFEEGYYFSPTIFTDVENDSYLCQEEVFGPILAIIPFTNEEEVIEMANDSKYGLTAGLWTKDISRAHRLSNEIVSGTVWVNTYRKIHWSVPYGGYKMSGIGRENGTEAINEYIEIKTVMIDTSE